MKENKHAQSIPADVLARAQAKIGDAIALLAPYVLSLTAAERRVMLKMGEKSLGFVEKAHEFAQQNPSLYPSYLNMPDFDADFQDAHGLWTLRSSALQLYETIDDTAMLAGGEAFQTALVFYNTVKMAAAQDTPGARAVYEELKTRFPGRPRKRGDAGTKTE